MEVLNFQVQFRLKNDKYLKICPVFIWVEKVIIFKNVYLHRYLKKKLRFVIRYVLINNPTCVLLLLIIQIILMSYSPALGYFIIGYIFCKII